MSRRILAFAVAVLGLALLGGCAQQVGDIDRTQPNKLRKADLDGEWYFRQVIVEVNGTANSTFEAFQGDMHRVVFDVTERELLLRRTDQDVIGADVTRFGAADGGERQFEDGFSAVAAFRIASHFDITRSYNASTGEQTNVITENTMDRPWYDREYLRPDFTRNLVNIDDQLDPVVRISRAANIAIAPTEDDTWFIERDEDGNAVYIDILQTYVLTPDWLECVLRFGFPLYGGWCGTETITARISLVKVTEESDYIPRIYNDLDMNRFGFFRTERAVDDPYYGTNDRNRRELANRWNIWERSIDDEGNIIPEAEREVRPIVFYLSYPFPEDLVAPSFEVAEQWSFAFRRTVAALQPNRSFDDIPRMMYACLNPGGDDLVPSEEFADEPLTVAAYEASNEGYRLGHCQRPGHVKNFGDLRYSFFNWIDHRQRGPLGYGPSSADPLTGEIVNANANIYGQAMNWQTQYVYDLVRLINGELDIEDIATGEHIQQYYDAIRERGNEELFFGRNKAVDEGPSPFERALQRRWDRHDRLVETALETVERYSFRYIIENGPEVLKLRNQRQASRLPELRNTPIERALMVPEITRMLTHGQFETAAEVPSDMMDFVSPLRALTMDAFLNIHERHHRELLQRNIHFAEDFDARMLRFAQQVAQFQAELRGTISDEERIEQLTRRMIRRNMYRSVQEHEVGHTVGLRHNFEASMDALNYFPQYWALREELTFNEDCDGQGFRTFDATGLAQERPAGTRCGEPASVTASRHADVAQSLRERGIHDYTYASIMDYGQLVNAFAGLGLYDYAAIAYGYGDVVEVFRTPPQKLAIEQRYDAGGGYDSGSSSIRRSSERVRDTRMRDVDNVERVFFAGSRELDEFARPWTYWHYSVLPIMFDGIRQPSGDPSAENYASNRFGLYDTFFDFEGVEGMFGMYDRRLVPREQAVADGAVQVPYRFCSDEFRGSSAYCNLWDNGSDEYEVFTNMRDMYENYYMLEMFRRGRSSFGLSLLPLYQRMLQRTMQPSLAAYQFWLLNASNRGPEWYLADWGGFASTLAGNEAINFLGEVITTPTVGTYAWNETEGHFLNISRDLDFRPSISDPVYGNLGPESFVNLNTSDGARFGSTQFRRMQDPDRPDADPERGYYSYLQYEVLSHFWGKLAALTALTSGSVNVIGADTQSDSSAFFISPYLVFGDDLTRFLGSMVNDEFLHTGHCVVNNGSGPEVQPIDLIRSNVNACSSGQLLNPYPSEYGNRDFNMRVFATVYAAAEFQQNLDMSWLDRSAVYVMGRGEEPEICRNDDDGVCGFEPVTYTDGNGLTYVAYYPTRAGTLPADANPWDHVITGRDEFRPGVKMVVQANNLEARMNALPAGTTEFFRARNRLESHIETMRFHIETAKYLGAMWNENTMWPRFE